MRNLIIALFFVIFAQALAYLQLQSQFFWTWAKEHPLVMSLTPKVKAAPVVPQKGGKKK